MTRTGSRCLRKILDVASQKGTGKWTAITALEEGTPLTLIGEAVFARFLSAIKDQRVAAAQVLPGPQVEFTGDARRFHPRPGAGGLRGQDHQLHAGLHADAGRGAHLQLESELRRRRLNVARGLHHPLGLPGQDPGSLRREPAALANLLLNDYFSAAVIGAQGAWREVVATGVKHGIPLPIMSGALAFYDGYRSARLPANLLQAQRDYFGAHTYERVDRPRGEYFHTNWTGTGGDVTAGSYDA